MSQRLELLELFDKFPLFFVGFLEALFDVLEFGRLLLCLSQVSPQLGSCLLQFRFGFLQSVQTLLCARGLRACGSGLPLLLAQ